MISTMEMSLGRADEGDFLVVDGRAVAVTVAVAVGRGAGRGMLVVVEGVEVDGPGVGVFGGRVWSRNGVVQFVLS